MVFVGEVLPALVEQQVGVGAVRPHHLGLGAPADVCVVQAEPTLELAAPAERQIVAGVQAGTLVADAGPQVVHVLAHGGGLGLRRVCVRREE